MKSMKLMLVTGLMSMSLITNVFAEEGTNVVVTQDVQNNTSNAQLDAYNAHKANMNNRFAGVGKYGISTVGLFTGSLVLNIAAQVGYNNGFRHNAYAVPGAVNAKWPYNSLESIEHLGTLTRAFATTGAKIGSYASLGAAGCALVAAGLYGLGASYSGARAYFAKPKLNK